MENNEKIKTLAYLNTKAWYRGIKVIYIFFVLVCYSVAVYLSIAHTVYIFNAQDEYRQEQISKNERLQKIQELKDLGQTTKQITNNLPSEFRRYGTLQLTREEYRRIYGEDSISKLDAVSPFRETKTEEAENYLWLLFYLPLYFITSFILSEIPKRIFYYVYFGKVKPEKDKFN
jgi:hypothetical protein